MYNKIINQNHIQNPSLNGSFNTQSRAISPTKFANLETPPKKMIKKIMHFNKNQIQSAIELYEWRIKTSLPIVKILQFQPCQSMCNKVARMELKESQKQKLSKQIGSAGQLKEFSVSTFYATFPNLDQYQLQVAPEQIKYRLSDLGILPFPQLIYLLKEMMIGYEVLIDVFGSFTPTEQMIIVSSSDKWKMWVNKEMEKNQKTESKVGEKEFICNLIKIVENHCKESVTTRQFFAMLKEFTYAKECTFVNCIQKINLFVKQNKILSVNKVILPNEKPKLPQDSFLGNKNNQTHNHLKHSYNSSSINLSYNNYSKNNHPVANNLNKSNNVKAANTPVSQMMTSQQVYMSPSQKHLPVAQSSLFYNPLQDKNFKQNNQNNRGTSIPKQKQILHRATIDVAAMNKFSFNLPHFAAQKQPQTPQRQPNRNISWNMNNSANIDEFYGFKSSSPKPINNLSSSPNPINFSSSPQKNRSQNNIVTVGHGVSRPQKRMGVNRKYSEQIIKVKSSQALLNNNNKKNYESIDNFDNQEVESPSYLFATPLKVESPNFSKKGKNSDNNALSTPNNSSSTKEVHFSSIPKNQQDKYISLKAVDLRHKNNQSSINPHGIDQSHEKRQLKHLATSYEFRNKNMVGSSQGSQSSSNKLHDTANKWNKKLSGLFSDDASIKQLKSSVKFKTNEQERYEKQYLKDVKLEMLQKFGRPVRQSIVDEEDDQKVEQYESMQLIEEVDEAKSYLEHQDKIEPSLIKLLTKPQEQIRNRNATCQIPKKTNKEEYPDIVQKDCFSEYYESEMGADEDSQKEDENGGFNFQSENYNIKGQM